jgi:uncharacterized membrane protein YeaQ/YmgE (transglycosylase-associated protein family)
VRFLSIVFVGFVAGWIVGLLRRGYGYGILGNVVIGIIGSWIGSFIFGFSRVQADSLTGSVLMSVVGALALLFCFSLVRPGKGRRSKSSKDDDE